MVHSLLGVVVLVWIVVERDVLVVLVEIAAALDALVVGRDAVAALVDGPVDSALLRDGSLDSYADLADSYFAVVGLDASCADLLVSCLPHA